jgi:hypothetical protein
VIEDNFSYLSFASHIPDVTLIGADEQELTIMQTGSHTSRYVPYPSSENAFVIQRDDGYARVSYLAKIDLSDTTDCTVSATPASMELSRQGGTATLNILTQDGCPWRLFDLPWWLEIVSQDGDESRGLGSGLGSVVVEMQ